MQSEPTTTERHTSSRKIYLRLLGQVTEYWKMFVVALLCMLVASLLDPIFPFLLKSLLDDGFSTGKNSALANTFLHFPLPLYWAFPLVVVSLFLVRGFFGFCADYAMAHVSNSLSWKLRQRIFSHLLTLSTTYYNANSSGHIISRIVYDVTTVISATTSVVTVLVRDTVTVIGLLAWMFYLNWQLTLITLVMLPVVALLVQLFSRRLRTASRTSQKAMGDISQVTEESIHANKVIKIYGSQRYEENRFDRASLKHRAYSMRYQVAAALVTPVVQVYAAIAIGIIIGIALYQAGQQATSIGSFVSFITAMAMMLSPIKRLTDVNAPLQRGLAGAESVFAMIDEIPEEDQGLEKLPSVRGEVVFSHVTFSYVDSPRPALDDVSFVLHAGQTLALVGASGGGKSTIANLIPRFYNVRQGLILVDGHNIATIQLAALRQHIAMVSQDVILFNDTVANNIAYGTASSIARQAILEAARAAHASEFIEALPNGYDTEIGENGVKLSGGQRQRIAIARALLKNAPILILDEATSALDTASERVVQEALENLMKNRTTLVIAHRLSTIERADRVLVLEQGRIVEEGTHSELLGKNGAYTRLHQLQFSSPINA